MFQLIEQKGDLFSCSGSLAHCVSRDFYMGKGIAVEFKKRFGGVRELEAVLTQHGCWDEGGYAYYIYYLVTKELYYHNND
jgi:hypothetical protein